MDCIVQVETAQNREYISLQDGDQQFESEKQDNDRHRENREDAEDRGEAGEYSEHRVARQHIGEESDRQCERADEIGQHLDRDQDDKQQRWYALGYEEPQKMQTVPDKADNRDAGKNDRRHRKGDDDLAGNAETIGDQTQQI